MSRTLPILFVVVSLLAGGGRVCAQSVETEIAGISGELLDNVRATLSLEQAEQMEQVSIWRLRQMSLDARDEVRQALQPFGYYNADVRARLIEPESEGAAWRARVEVDPGEVVRVVQPRVSVGAVAADLDAFAEWRADWPLPDGAALRHPPYRQALDELERIAESHGFFEGEFATRRIRVDPARNEASIEVDYNPGARYTIGEIDNGDQAFKEDLMRALTVLEPGQPFVSSDIDRQREVLVRSGYYDSVVIEQHRDAERDAVDIRYRLERRPPNTYRVLAGFGTDTGARLQLGWTRHWLSDRGDRLDARFGAQQTDREFVARVEYQLPYGNQPGNFLFTDVLLRRERDRFRFEDEERIEPVFEPFGGDRNQAQFMVGRLRDRPLLKPPFEPLQERLFLTFLNERFDAFSQGSLSDEQAALLAANPRLEPLLETDTNTVAAGGEWTLLQLTGEKFNTEGLHARARILGSVGALGSDTSFLQGYLQGRWHWRFLPRHKLLLRGEIGYTLADTRSLNLSIPGDPRRLDLEVTELPELFRFKAGGDRSVRGYSFEALSTNRNGANHILVGSVEYEYRLFGDYSIAGFYDIGNAFNDFGNPELKRGVGLGLRWYSVIGPVQLDVARAIDDDSLRIHFTIGTKLL